MKTFRRFIRRLSNFVLRRRSDDRLREEATWHLDILTEENLHAGMTPKEARRQAAIRFGGMNVIREEYRDEESIPALENLLLDVRYAVRVLLMSPTFCVVALLTVALGIAANVLVFGIINAAILHPLDVSDPGNLYQLRPKAVVRGHLLTTSYPAFLDFRHRASSFVDLAAYNGYSSGELKLGAGQIKIYGYEVTGNYFDVLGVSPAQGHLFHEDPSSTAGSAPSLVLSDAFWQRQFHGKPEVVGSVITVDGKPYSVIGIAPPGFHGTERLVWPDYWIRLSNELQVGSESAYLHSRTEHAVTVLGRLKPGVSPEQGSRELSVIAVELSREYPLTDSAASFRLIHPGLAGDEGKSIRGFLFALGTLVLLMLGAICANLASLSEVRLADRRRELAIRVALGTGRARLIRQLTLESLLIAIIGGGLGLLAGVFLLSFLNRLDLPLGHLAIHLEPRIYGVGVALTLVSALLFGLVPAWRATRRSPWKMMTGVPRRPRRLRQLLSSDLFLCIQVTICSFLIMAGFVALRGTFRALNAPLGFDPHGAVIVHVDLSRVQSGKNTAQTILDALSRLPGVAEVGAISRLPMTGGLHGSPVFPSGSLHLHADEAAFRAYVFSVSPTYLRVARTRIIAGLDSPSGNDSSEQGAAVVNEVFATKMWPSKNALGQEFIYEGRRIRVLGVTETGKYHDLEESQQPVLYLLMSPGSTEEMEYVARTALMPRDLATQLSHSLNTGNTDIPIEARTWGSVLQGETFRVHVAMLTLGTLALLAGMLAVTGVFGTATYSLSRRMKEFGIFVALGAQRPALLQAALGRTFAVLIVGTLSGMLLGVFTGPLWGWLAYETRPNDPVVISATLLAMLLLGTLASVLPARRVLFANAGKLLRRE